MTGPSAAPFRVVSTGKVTTHMRPPWPSGRLERYPSCFYLGDRLGCLIRLGAGEQVGEDGGERKRGTENRRFDETGLTEQAVFVLEGGNLVTACPHCLVVEDQIRRGAKYDNDKRLD